MARTFARLELYKGECHFYHSPRCTDAAFRSPVFGEVMSVWVGAMLVASTFMTVAEGDTVKRGEEVSPPLTVRSSRSDCRLSGRIL